MNGLIAPREAEIRGPRPAPVSQLQFAFPPPLEPQAPAPRACQKCGKLFEPYRKWHRFCSEACQRTVHNLGPRWRDCKVCRKPFLRAPDQSNKWHCSTACARTSAKRSRAEFRDRRPGRESVYRETLRCKRRRDTDLVRLWRKYPELPRFCEACGESRVLDIAHRPEHARRGAWATAENSTPDKIWVLCPTCHALLDRLRFTAAQLGIRERAWAS